MGEQTRPAPRTLFGSQKPSDRFKLLVEPGVMPKYERGIRPGVFLGIKPSITSQQLAGVTAARLALGRQVADIVGASRVVNDLTRQMVPDLSTVVAASIKLPSARNLLGPAIGVRLDAMKAFSEPWRIVAPAIYWAGGNHRALITTTPVRERVSVRRFLSRLHPQALAMLDGIYDVLELSNGTGASAYSATELLKLVTFQLITMDEVRSYALRTHGVQKPQMHHSIELIGVKFAINVTLLLALTRQANLLSDLQRIKHCWHLMDPSAARTELMSLIDELEAFLVLLAQSID